MTNEYILDYVTRAYVRRFPIMKLPSGAHLMKGDATDMIASDYRRLHRLVYGPGIANFLLKLLARFL